MYRTFKALRLQNLVHIKPSFHTLYRLLPKNIPMEYRCVANICMPVMIGNNSLMSYALYQFQPKVPHCELYEYHTDCPELIKQCKSFTFGNSSKTASKQRQNSDAMNLTFESHAQVLVWMDG